eukprot:jgi/Botrbrau1/18818/Bobra.0855s0001.2
MTGMVVACEGRRRAWCVDPSQKVRIFFCNLSNGVWLRRLRGDGGGGRWHFTIVSPRKRRRWLNARKGKFLGTGDKASCQQPPPTGGIRHLAKLQKKHGLSLDMREATCKLARGVCFRCNPDHFVFDCPGKRPRRGLLARRQARARDLLMLEGEQGHGDAGLGSFLQCGQCRLC